MVKRYIFGFSDVDDCMLVTIYRFWWQNHDIGHQHRCSLYFVNEACQIALSTNSLKAHEFQPIREPAFGIIFLTLQNLFLGGNETDESTKMFFIAENELKTELYKDYIWEKISDNGKMSLETFLKFRSPANQ